MRNWIPEYEEKAIMVADDAWEDDLKKKVSDSYYLGKCCIL